MLFSILQDKNVLEQPGTPTAKTRLHVRAVFSDTGCAIWISIRTFVCSADLPAASRNIRDVQHKSQALDNVLWSDPIRKLLEVTAMAEVFARGHTATILSHTFKHHLIASSNLCNTSMWSRKEMKSTRSD